jgi:hypothetical protein
MKFVRLKLLFVVGLLSFLVSCDDDSKKEDSVTYYIEFKMNGGELIRFETEEPGYQTCGNCGCSLISTMIPSNAAGISFCNEAENFSANNIESLDGASFEFTNADFPQVFFAFELDLVHYASAYADNQVGTLTVTNVMPDGTSGSYAMYKVTGEFECTVRPDLSSPDIAITEGKFVIQLSEN